MNNNELSNEKREAVIGESTSVKIGLLLCCLGAFSGAIWWASSINSKLDYLISSQSTFSVSISELKNADIAVNKDLSDFKVRTVVLEESLKSLKEKISIK